MPEGYMPRLVENRLDALMESFGCAETNGPKWCGKTRTARNGVGAASCVGHEREPSGNVQNPGKGRAWLREARIGFRLFAYRLRCRPSCRFPFARGIGRNVVGRVGGLAYAYAHKRLAKATTA